MASLLITQCLQNDFVKPIGRHEPIPNVLHIGHHESLRLMGKDPKEGAVAQIMQWAYRQPDEKLQLMHVRDWHDEQDPAQKSHLEQFGSHCIKNTEGAEFAFEVPKDNNKQVEIINSLTLNDFQGTGFAESLAKQSDHIKRVGIIGVWTEAKVSFLCYELAVCSVLTASNSRR